MTHVDVSTLSLVLLTIGVAGFMGTTAIGTFLKWNFRRTMVGIPILMAVIALALTFFGDDLAAVFILLGVWGLVATAAPVGWWSWLAKTLPGDAEAGGGLMVAVVQLAIALGSTMGGLLFDASGYRSTFFASASILLIAAFLAFLTTRSQRVAAA